MTQLLINANPKGGFTVSAHGETWLECPAMIAVDANGEKDSDERFLPMMSYEQKTEEGKTEKEADRNFDTGGTSDSGAGTGRFFPGKTWKKSEPGRGR